MPFTKELIRQLRALKSGDDLSKQIDSLIEEHDDVVMFPNDGAFLDASERKVRAKVAEAERKAADAKREADESTEKLAGILKEIGVESADKIDEFKTKLATANGSLTEVDKLRGELKEAGKKITKLEADNADLGGFKIKVVKNEALAPHLAKVHPDFRDMVSENILAKLTIDDKGAVTAPEGKAIGDFVDGLINAKPSLKAPDFKDGAGTGKGGKTDNDGKGAGAGDGKGGGAGGGGNGPPKTFAQVFAETAIAEHAKLNGAGTAGP